MGSGSELQDQLQDQLHGPPGPAVPAFAPLLLRTVAAGELQELR